MLYANAVSYKGLEHSNVGIPSGGGEEWKVLESIPAWVSRDDYTHFVVAAAFYF